MTPAESSSPRSLRWALVVAVIWGALVSFSAAQDISVALAAPSLGRESLEPLRHFVEFPKEQEEALVAQHRATLGAVRSMVGARVAILIILSGAASMVLVAAMRIRWSVGGPKAGMARLLASAALVAGIFRTLDGAQELAIVREGAAAAGKVLHAQQTPDAELSAQAVMVMSSTLSVARTVIVVAVLLALSAYFRSARVAEALRS